MRYRSAFRYLLFSERYSLADVECGFRMADQALIRRCDGTYFTVITGSSYGLMMGGNVCEWVSDWYSETYYSVLPRNNPLGPDAGTRKVNRGSSWYEASWGLHVSFRDAYTPDYDSGMYYSFGIRCAASYPRK